MKNKMNGLIGLLLVGMLCGSAYAKKEKPATYVLRSDTLEVTLDSSFPRVISYKQLDGGATFAGQSMVISNVLLNGEAYVPVVDSIGPGKVFNRRLARYNLFFPTAGKVTMTAAFSLKGSILTFKIYDINDKEAFRISSIEIPDQSLLSVSSSDPKAALAAAQINPDKSKQMDEFLAITTDLPKEDRRTTAAYAILCNGNLAASIENNSAYDNPKKGTKVGNGRIRVHLVVTDEGATASLCTGEWTYRAKDSKLTTKTLWTKIIITGDRNGDEVVDCQDGTVAFRDIMRNPFEAELTPNRIAQHISFNFASQAGQPFLSALDNVKRIYYATDGLGQFLLLKGYQSEGHDSAHPDYGGNIGRRQGGKKDMNILINTAHKWNAEVGVHINCQESYPEAKSFNEELVKVDRGGWNWIDQSYIIDHRRDITSGTFEKRVKHMMKDVPNLDFIYMDVYFGDGWLSQEMARILNRAGVGVTTEFPSRLEHSATWSHWSVDMTYGPDTSRGINSHIVRFIRNHQKDMYLKHPLLGHAELGDFEGWQGRTDFNEFLEKLYDATLPSKYMQHFLIMKWQKHEINFTDGVRVTDANGQREIYRDDRLLLKGSAYLLPWEPKKESKLYHWNKEGGETTWTLPPSWKTQSVKFYKLTDTGRVFESDIPVENGQITLVAEAATPYVIYPKKAPKEPKANWGEGSLVKDPNFYDTTLADWQVNGDGVSVVVDDHVRSALTFGASSRSITVSQRISGLSEGTYSASVWVEVDKPGRMATLLVDPDNGEAVKVWTDSSPLENTVNDSQWNRTRFQRMRVLFDVPKGSTSALLTLAAGSGTQRVRFDEIRVVPTVRAERKGYEFFEDFENVDDGWFPFAKGSSGGVTDPRTHLSERHDPYTDAGWNGKLIDDTIGGDWSLKSHSERLANGSTGLVYRTLPQTIRFVPGKKYEILFSYQCAYDDEYAFVVAEDTENGVEILKSFPLPKTGKTCYFSTKVKPINQNLWFGVQRLRKNQKGRKEIDLVIDNVGVRRLDK